MAMTHRAHQRKCVEARIAGRHLPARLGAGDDPREDPDDAIDDIVVPDACEIREIPRFTDHHSGNHRHPAALHHPGSGAPLDGERHIWWNFVSSSKERIEQAKEDWKEGRFPKVPGDEAEFIPLPE
jgi:hypothetical protein